MLDCTPTEPNRNRLEDNYDNNEDNDGEQDRDTEVKILTLQQESDLAETLAFLTAFNDDPKKVTAVCVEQDHSGEGLTF